MFSGLHGASVFFSRPLIIRKRWLRRLRSKMAAACERRPKTLVKDLRYIGVDMAASARCQLDRILQKLTRNRCWCPPNPSWLSPSNLPPEHEVFKRQVTIQLQFEEVFNYINHKINS